jgi:hypothetical protein
MDERAYYELPDSTAQGNLNRVGGAIRCSSRLTLQEV